MIAAKKLLLIVRPYVQQETDTLPAMTSNTAPAGHRAESNTPDSNANLAYQVFDKAGGGTHIINLNGRGWVQRETPSKIRVWKFSVTSRSGSEIANQAPRDFTLQGSNDKNTWTNILSVTGQTGWASGETRSFEIPSRWRSAFLVHRLNVEANNGSASLAINELRLFQEVR